MRSTCKLGTAPTKVGEPQQVLERKLKCAESRGPFSASSHDRRLMPSMSSTQCTAKHKMCHELYPMFLNAQKGPRSPPQCTAKHNRRHELHPMYIQAERRGRGVAPGGRAGGGRQGMWSRSGNGGKAALPFRAQQAGLLQIGAQSRFPHHIDPDRGFPLLACRHACPASRPRHGSLATRLGIYVHPRDSPALHCLAPLQARSRRQCPYFPIPTRTSSFRTQDHFPAHRRVS